MGKEKTPRYESGEVPNAKRALWADHALLSFAEETGQADSGDLMNDREQVIGDLVADLMHLCDCHDIDAEELIEAAAKNYQEEVALEVEEPKQKHREMYYIGMPRSSAVIQPKLFIEMQETSYWVLLVKSDGSVIVNKDRYGLFCNLEPGESPFDRIRDDPPMEKVI